MSLQLWPPSLMVAVHRDVDNSVLRGPWEVLLEIKLLSVKDLEEIKADWEGGLRERGLCLAGGWLNVSPGWLWVGVTSGTFLEPQARPIK